jgi:heat shock protein HtpX
MVKTERWLRVSLICGLACQALPGQTGKSDNADHEPARGYVTLTPKLRSGDLFVHINVYDFPEVDLATIRQASLPCDWLSQYEGETALQGVCRNYLKSDGTSAKGDVSLAPLANALLNAGADDVCLELIYPSKVPVEAPAGWRLWHDSSPKRKTADVQTINYRFWTPQNGIPDPVAFRIGTPWSPFRLILALAVTLFVPALLSFCLRWRAERQGTAAVASIWIQWILTATWLYWMSAAAVDDVLALPLALHWNHVLAEFLTGVVVFACPPMIATAACVAILMVTETGEKVARPKLIWKSIAGQAVLMVPLSMFLVGSGLHDQEQTLYVASLIGAYLTYRILKWFTARAIAGNVEVLTRGELAGSAAAIAQRAGVKLGGIYVLGNREEREANAFASSGKILAMTRGLVERLTRREVNAVIAHEMGHFRGKHVGTRTTIFWLYILLLVPFSGFLIERLHLPMWVLSVPIIPLGYILATSFLSRKNEFSADVASVELTGDPEGMIAALARLRRITRSPVDWGGIQGSILSHPSMRNRVTALGRKFGVPEERALAILGDPDLLEADTSGEERYYSLPEECVKHDLIFTSTSKAQFQMWSSWTGNLGLAAIALAVCSAGLLMVFQFKMSYVMRALPFSFPLVAWLYLHFLNWQDRMYIRNVRRKLVRQMGRRADGGTFMGLLPGDSRTPLEGFYFWDVGFLFLTPDCLTYRGERSRFSIPRGAILKVTVEKGPLAWDRSYGVMLHCEGGCFQLSRPDRGESRRVARKIERRINAWLRGEPVHDNVPLEPAPAPGRDLFQASRSYFGGWRAVRVLGLRAFMLVTALALISGSIHSVRWALAVTFVAILAPAGYLLAVCPYFFRRKPQVPKLSTSQHRTTSPQEIAVEESAPAPLE